MDGDEVPVHGQKNRFVGRPRPDVVADERHRPVRQMDDAEGFAVDHQPARFAARDAVVYGRNDRVVARFEAGGLVAAVERVKTPGDPAHQVVVDDENRIAAVNERADGFPQNEG
ncbi:MAG: hypothetical protein M5R36_25610 [Deltaproteobacteria bacterium]|nr:hypothetical protein [Deltaproteobacteria bacterium]